MSTLIHNYFKKLQFYIWHWRSRYWTNTDWIRLQSELLGGGRWWAYIIFDVLKNDKPHHWRDSSQGISTSTEALWTHKQQHHKLALLLYLEPYIIHQWLNRGTGNQRRPGTGRHTASRAKSTGPSGCQLWQWTRHNFCHSSKAVLSAGGRKI